MVNESVRANIGSCSGLVWKPDAKPPELRDDAWTIRWEAFTGLLTVVTNIDMENQWSPKEHDLQMLGFPWCFAYFA